jgi:hypothetical protein
MLGKSSLRSIFHDARSRAARDELRDAENAYSAAEDRLIKARREYQAVEREWNDFYRQREQS